MLLSAYPSSCTYVLRNIKENWLFSDTLERATASMRVYSMVETAKANGLDPLKYLTFLLENRPKSKISDEKLALPAPWSEEAMGLTTKNLLASSGTPVWILDYPNTRRL